MYCIRVSKAAHRVISPQAESGSANWRWTYAGSRQQAGPGLGWARLYRLQALGCWGAVGEIFTLTVSSPSRLLALALTMAPRMAPTLTLTHVAYMLVKSNPLFLEIYCSNCYMGHKKPYLRQRCRSSINEHEECIIFPKTQCGIR